METETHYKLLKLLERNPNLTQRQMSVEMGLSLGKFNYCLKALVESGTVKIERFKSSDNKASYMYLLTPRGVEEKTRVTNSFLRRKIKEFEAIQKQIEELVGEVDQMRSKGDAL